LTLESHPDCRAAREVRTSSTGTPARAQVCNLSVERDGVQNDAGFDRDLYRDMDSRSSFPKILGNDSPSVLDCGGDRGI
jgi:hypothetical protein